MKCSPLRQVSRTSALCRFALTVLVLAWVPTAAARDVAVVPLTITVQAPAFLYLDVGSPGGVIDMISFRVGGLPGSGPVRGEASGAYPVPVRALGLLPAFGRVSLMVDAGQPLTDGMGHTIPFSQISWQGSGDVPSGRFTGVAQQIILTRSVPSGRLSLQGAMAFFYDNTLFSPAGIYRGQVTYTLSAP